MPSDRSRSRAAAAAAAEPPPPRQRTKFDEQDAAAVAAEMQRLDARVTGDEPPDGVTPYGKPPPRPEVEVPGLVLRAGRILVDGSRRGARWVARRTVYLSPKQAAMLEAYARDHDLSLGEAVDIAIDRAGFDKQGAA